MLRSRYRPVEWHQVAGHEGPLEGCQACVQDRARCGEKQVYFTVEHAELAAGAQNAREWAPRPLKVAYACTWCENWHLSTADTSVERTEAARLRDQWLERTAPG